jgi:predicted CXXCH cytochrome family protein
VTEHPYVEPAKITSETCLGCHPGKAETKFVHTAVVAGCENCHRAASDQEKQKTAVTLVARGGELCRRCHETEKALVLHAPYETGECLLCHEAHGSEFPGNIRAEANTLCMACHVANHPAASVDNAHRTVTLLGAQAYSLEGYNNSPKIRADHPMASVGSVSGRRVTGKNPKKADASKRCVSCHEPHASQAAMLLR